MLSADHFQFRLGDTQPVDGFAERLPGEALSFSTSSVQPLK
jgi:hypothetical protein